MNHTTRRGVLAALASAGTAAVAGCVTQSQSHSRAPTTRETTTAGPAAYGRGSYPADTAVENTTGSLAYTAVAGRLYRRIPAERLSRHPPDGWPATEAIDALVPPAGWRLAVVEFRVQNLADTPQSAPRSGDRVTILNQPTGVAHDTGGEADVRPAGCGDCARLSHPLAALAPTQKRVQLDDQLAPDATGTLRFAALAPQDSDPAALAPALGTTQHDDAPHPVRWTGVFTDGEPTASPTP